MVAGPGVNTWSFDASTLADSPSSGRRSSKMKKPRPCVATSRSWLAFWNFTSHTGAVGKPAVSFVQVPPSSDE